MITLCSAWGVKEFMLQAQLPVPEEKNCYNPQRTVCYSVIISAQGEKIKGLHWSLVSDCLAHLCCLSCHSVRVRPSAHVI